MGSEPPPWTILFYRDAVGREPVREWLEDLEKTNPREHTSVRHHVDLLEEFGVVLEEPYTRQLSGAPRAATRAMESYLLLRSEAEVRPPDELPEEVQDDGPEGAQTRDEVDGLGAQGDGGTMTVTSWSNYKTKHPMSEEAKATYAKDREAMGVGYLVLKARAAAAMSQAQLARA